MAKLGQTQALRTVDTIYRFPQGARSPDEGDVERPLQFVHDVSRAAELNTCLVTVHEVQMATGGAGAADYQSVDKRNLITSVNATAAKALDLGLTPANTDVWLLAISCAISAASAANLNDAFAAIYPPVNSNYGPATSELYASTVGYWQALLDVDFQAGGAWQPLYDSLGSPGRGARTILAPLPRRIGQLRFRATDDATGVATYSFRCLIAICPQGVEPPLG